MEITENAEDIDDCEMKTEVTATKRLKIPVVEVPLTEEQLERIVEIDIFLAEHDVKVNRKKKKLLAALSVGPYETYKLGVIVANCCKDMDLEKGFQSYLNARSRDIKPNAMTFSNLLSLTAGFGEQGSSLAPPRTTEPPQNIEAAFVVFEDFKKSAFPVHESVFTAMIRCCAVNNQMDKALQLYYEMQEMDIIPKIRTISPILAGFSALGNEKICFELFRDLVEEYELPPAEKEYLSMLKVTVICRDKRFYTVLHQYMEDILVPSPSAWEVLKQWFLECENDNVGKGEGLDGAVIERYIVGESEVRTDGSIELTGHRLLSVDLDPVTRAALLDQVESFATARTEGYTSHNKRSKSKLASPSSLLHDIDRGTNKHVANANIDSAINTDNVGNENGDENGDGKTIDICIVGNSSSEHAGGVSTNNTADTTKPIVEKGESNGINQRRTYSKESITNNAPVVSVCLTSKGRIASANNRLSFNTSVVGKEVEKEVVGSDAVLLGKRTRGSGEHSAINTKDCSDVAEMKVNVIGIVEKGEDIVVDENEDDQEEKRIKMDNVRKTRHLSKTSKWTDFTSWVSNIMKNDEEKERARLNDEEVEVKRNEEEIDITDTLQETVDKENVQTAVRTCTSKSCTYDVIVDGANVGYYKQNFSGAPTHIDYRQVDWMVRQLICRGYKPLLILHCRHLAPGVVPEDRMAIVEAWEKEGLLYQTPQGCNDDWFWLYIAVALKCQVVTNDEMRDHHFQMLLPRWFERWKERNQIHFSFGQWLDSIEDCCSNKNGKYVKNTGIKIEKNEGNFQDGIKKEMKLESAELDSDSDKNTQAEIPVSEIVEVTSEAGSEKKGKKGEDRNKKNDNPALAALAAGKKAVMSQRSGKKGAGSFSYQANKVRQACLKVPLVYSYRSQRLPPAVSTGEHDDCVVPMVEGSSADVVENASCDSHENKSGSEIKIKSNILEKNISNCTAAYYFPSTDSSKWLCAYKKPSVGE